MSADNYAICPKCNNDVEDKVRLSYGKVTEDEYISLLKKKDDIYKHQTLREDCEIGTDKYGLFYVSYSCSCSVCHFSYEYKQEKQVYSPKEDK